jgi:hypothetical protein
LHLLQKQHHTAGNDKTHQQKEGEKMEQCIEKIPLALLGSFHFSTAL